ncbi:MAG: hypothetical protein AB7G15_06525 [Alphaproteobacteria bacterium]
MAVVAIIGAAAFFCALAAAESPRAPEKISWQLALEPTPGPIGDGKSADDYTRPPVMTVDAKTGVFVLLQTTDAQRARLAPMGAHIAPDGKIVWRRPLTELLGYGVSAARFIGGGRLVIYGEIPQDQRVRAKPDEKFAFGRFVVLSPTGEHELTIPMYRAAPSTHVDRPESDDDSYELRLAPSRDNGFVAFGGFGSGPYTWWLARYDAAGKQLWQQGDGRLLLTQIDDVRQWMDGRLAVLWVQGALSAQAPAAAQLRVLNAQGHVAQRYAISRYKSACYRFAGERVVVGGFKDRIAWFDFTGRLIRSVAVSASPCPLDVAPDGSAVWEMHKYADAENGKTLPASVAGIRAGEKQPRQFALPDVAKLAVLPGGSFIALLHGPKPSRAFVVRRYD